MDFSWAASIPKTSAPFLVPMKRFSNVRVAEVDDYIWLQGEPVSQKERLDVEECLRRISGALRFDRRRDGQLVPSGMTLPSSRLPQLTEGGWAFLTDWITFGLPESALPGTVDNLAEIEIVRRNSSYANQTQQPTILVCRIQEFVAWADNASAHRVGRLSFACNHQGVVIVRGKPLPLLPGKTFVDYEQVAIETGCSWWPVFSIDTLKGILRLGDSQLLLCQPGEKFQSIELNDFVAATRAGIRATGKKFENLQKVP